MNGIERLVTPALACGFLMLGSAGLLDAQGLYQAKPGDQVDIAFYTASGAEVREISGSRWLEPSGEMYLPYIGLAKVAGLDSNGIRDVLLKRFAAFYDDPVIEVVVKVRVNVTGSVRSPGHFYVDPASTLLDALAVAGGPAGEVDLGTVGGAADQSRVQLLRNGQLEELDFRPERSSAETIYRLVESGDWLYVPPQARSRWRDNLQFIGSVLTVVAAGVFITNELRN